MTSEITAPRSIGELLDDTVKLYRKSFAQWWLPSLLVSIAGFAWGYYYNSAIGWGAAGKAFDFFKAGAIGWSALPALIAFIAVSLWAHAALYVGLEAAHAGTASTTGEIASDAARLVPRFFRVGFVSGILLLLSLLALVLPVFYVAGRLAVALPVAAIERQGAFATVGRAWALTKGSYWRVTGVLFVAYVLVVVVAMMLVGLLVIVAAIIFRGDIVMIGLVTLVLQAVQTFIISAFLPAAGIVLYHDLRNRIDGDDLERRAEALAAG